MYDTVIIRYGEIFLKSEFVRRTFEKALVMNLRFKIRQMNLEGTFSFKRHRIYLKTDHAEELADALADVFGVVSTSPAIETKANMEDICDLATGFSEKIIREKETFAVRAERTGSHNFSSKEVEALIGEKIRNSLNAVVDLENPMKTIFVEIREESAFVFDRKIAGVGGLPYGTQGRVIAFVSGDISSGISAWMMMRRGCEIFVVRKRGSGKEIIERLRRYSNGRMKEYEITETGEILRILRDMAEKENAHGIVLGFNLDEFQKNTKSMKNVKIPVYLPVIGMDKGDMEKIARRVGFRCQEY